VPGASDIQTFLESFRTAFEAAILAVMSVNYETLKYVAESLIGTETPGAKNIFLSVNVRADKTQITTVANHGLQSGNVITISDVVAPPGVNGDWVVTVTGANSFDIPYANAALPAWDATGFYSRKISQPVWSIGDRGELLPIDHLGLITGDAMTLFDTVSARRLNPGVGRSFRSRLSFSPLGESQNVDGKLTSGGLTAWTSALNDMGTTNLANGGDVDFSSNMAPMAVSLKQATILGPVPTQSATWCKRLTNIVPQPNLGSLTRRKPRLTAAIG
jgi:hypothetical protein